MPDQPEKSQRPLSLDPEKVEAVRARLAGVFTGPDPLNRVAITLMAAWEVAEGKPVSASYVATFADMARSVVDHHVPPVCSHNTDWGVRDDTTGHVGTVGAYNRRATEEWLAELTEPSTLMRRERTIYEDAVTDWVEVVTSPAGGES